MLVSVPFSESSLHMGFGPLPLLSPMSCRGGSWLRGRAGGRCAPLWPSAETILPTPRPLSRLLLWSRAGQTGRNEDPDEADEARLEGAAEAAKEELL
mmetsp:Transcript_37263/g.87507  ORF Transcript_37263/g.87507 Transcript_37263/m.87507 type:complete len:97 (-) Transcript_37263:370-660(-)